MKSVFLFCRQYLSTLCYSVNPGYNTGIYAVALLLIFLFNIVAKCWKFYFCCCSVIACLSFCHRLQHARLPWPSLSPRVCSNSCPFSWWYYLTMPSSTTLLSFFLSFPESRSFPVSQIFESHGQSVVALFNINLSNEYSAIISFRIDWFPCSPRVSPAPQFKSINSLTLRLVSGPSLTSYMSTGKVIAVTI